MFSEFVGLEQDVCSAIESRRESLLETKSDILRRALGLQKAPQLGEASLAHFDFGQGVRLQTGEKLFLYLTKPSNAAQRPDGIGKVTAQGIEVNGVSVTPSRGSYLAPAMHIIQREKGHVDKKGNPKSLNAYRQWHVVREGKLVALEDLKEPGERRRRMAKASTVDVAALLSELGIA